MRSGLYAGRFSEVRCSGWHARGGGSHWSVTGVPCRLPGREPHQLEPRFAEVTSTGSCSEPSICGRAARTNRRLTKRRCGGTTIATNYRVYRKGAQKDDAIELIDEGLHALAAQSRVPSVRASLE